jgi:hypothetical protein
VRIFTSSLSLSAFMGVSRNSFMNVPLKVNAEGYEISPLLLDIMQTKRFARDDDTKTLMRILTCLMIFAGLLN